MPGTSYRYRRKSKFPEILNLSRSAEWANNSTNLSTPEKPPRLCATFINSNGSRQHKCPDCHKWLSYKYTLDRHQKEFCNKPHNTDGKWICLLCLKRFKHKGSLTRHMNPKEVRCVMCDKLFAQKSCLIRHLENKHNRVNTAIPSQSTPVRVEVDRQQPCFGISNKPRVRFADGGVQAPKK